MKKHLFFICPTDHLEGIINRRFKQENYFLTSLGNSLQLEYDSVNEIQELILRRNITEISFVLAHDNRFVLDALHHAELARVSGMGNFYHSMSKLHRKTKIVWQPGNFRTLTLSHLLVDQIKALKSRLKYQLNDRIQMDAKIYDRSKNQFNDAAPELYHLERFCLN